MSQVTTYEELKRVISHAYPDMPKQLQRIARFALDKPHELALGTVAAIAESTEVQPSSMIRFANALGYGGFSEMQQIFRSHLVERSDSYRDRISRMRNGHDVREAPTGVLHQFVSEAMGELGHLEDTVQAANFRQAVKLLAGAERINVLAQRRSFPVA